MNDKLTQQVVSEQQKISKRSSKSVPLMKIVVYHISLIKL